MTNDDFTILTSAEYWQEILQKLPETKRGDRIAMTAMGYDPADPIIERVLHELLAAADRGVEVYLSIDAYNFLYGPHGELPGFLWWQGSLSHPPRSRQKSLQILRDLDAKPTGFSVITNIPKRRFGNPSGGRSHIKYAVINDQAYVGGCNLRHSDWMDLMVRRRDADMADYLYGFSRELHQKKSTAALMQGKDRELAAGPLTTLYIDAGKKRQSIIFDKALELIDSAEKTLFMTCQYFPNSVTAQHLAAAHRRGVKVEVVYAHPSMQGYIGGVGQRISLLIEKLRMPAELFKHQLPKTSPGLHAKLLASEKSAIIGSHNYVSAGVLFGTAEMALLRHDPAFAKNAVQKIREQLPSA